MSRYHEYSQHFLSGPRLVAELIGHSNIRKNDLVYDLGAGSGVITSVLAQRCRQVIAVEVEPSALAQLKQNIARYENVKIIQKDILALTPPNGPYKIFANIPFSISADVVRKFTESPQPPKSTYLILQKQFARKLIPGTDHFTSQLGTELGPVFSARIRKPLRKTDFTPPPAVETVLFELKPREIPLIPQTDMVRYRAFIKQCYSRQQFFAQILTKSHGIRKDLRPSQLDLSDWVELFKQQ